MLRKLIIGLIGLAVAAGGVAMFSAFTAQMVNLEAHVEKEIELQPVVDCGADDPETPQRGPTCHLDPDGGNYGTVIPQELYDKIIELTLSNSWFDQDKWFDTTFDVLWECKQYADLRDEDGDGFPDCRTVEDPALHDPSHPNEELDGYLRDYVQSIATENRCIVAAQGPNPSRIPPEKNVELIGSGVIDKLNAKCFYAIKLLAPPCSDSFNPYTDPRGPDVKTIDCHLDTHDSDDIQRWDRFADIGDEFKIQVTGHSLTP